MCTILLLTELDENQFTCHTLIRISLVDTYYTGSFSQSAGDGDIL